MASDRKRREQKKQKLEKTLILVFSGIMLLLVLLSIGISISETTENPLITWDDIYSAIGAGVPETQALQHTQGMVTRVHFIDVGQGDAVLLEQDGCFALIDAGLPSAAEDLLAYLEKAGVEKLEFMLMTHPHADHIGGMQDVIRKIPVGQMILPDFSKAPMATSAVFLNLLECIEENGIPAVTAETGQIYPLGSAAVTVVGDGVETDNLNDISVTTLFEAPGMRFLSSGDAEKAAEQGVLEEGMDIRADLFKAGHHGSSTSNTMPFLEAICPKTVVISCGRDNSYGHPHDEAMEAFAQIGAEVYRTDLDGTVIAYVDDDGTIKITRGSREAA